VQGTHGGPVEPEQAAALEDAIDDGLRQIIVVQYPAHPLSDLFVVNAAIRLGDAASQPHGGVGPGPVLPPVELLL
jgi:hypothetical protein